MVVKPTPSALTAALDAVSDRWSLQLVRHLAFGPARFTDLVRATAAPRDVLTAHLRSLEQDGVLRRIPYGSGKREQYELTRQGTDLAEVVLLLKKWGDRYGKGNQPSPVLVHNVCGQVFEAQLHCTACGQPLGNDELTERPVVSGG